MKEEEKAHTAVYEATANAADEVETEDIITMARVFFLMSVTDVMINIL